MKGRYRPHYLARHYEQEVVAKGKCLLDGSGPYKPLFRIVDFPSKGFRPAIWSWIAQRPLELMSNPELRSVYYFHAQPQVVQIFEQVALHPEETQRIAHELNVDHPSVREGDIVMSTDLVLEESTDAGRTRRAVSIKRHQDMNPRTYEKFAIESEYWRRRGLICTLLFEDNLPRIVVENMALVFDWHEVEKLPCDGDVTSLVRVWITPHVLTECTSLASLCMRCDRVLRLKSGTALAVAFHLIVRRQLRVDLTWPILPAPRCLPQDLPSEN